MTGVDPTRGDAVDDGFDGEFLREARLLGSLAGGDPELSDAPDGLWDRIAAALDDAAVPPPDSPRLLVVDEPVEGTDFQETLAASPHGRRLRSPRHRIVFAVAAAVLAVLVGAGVLVARRDNGPSTVASAVLAPYGGAQVGAARGKVQLVDSGGRLRLRVDMHDLPAPAPGTFYEMWLIDPATGAPVSVASMKEPTPDVAAVIDVPPGTDPSRYDVVDVSVQRLDGGPEHSGNSVLRGTLTT
ncbi:MAG: anti-sigma factor [Actinobacteria bacterium]|nr:anti-sigma factor [Actinomycetota bacterium]